MPEFTESEFRAWLERRGVTQGVSPWEELPAIEEVRGDGNGPTCAAIAVQSARDTFNRVTLMPASAKACSLSSTRPEAQYSVCGVPVVMGDER